MPNPSKECRNQALAGLELALDSAVPKEKQRKFARFATRWITLARDLEAIEAQLKLRPEGALHEPEWQNGKLMRDIGNEQNTVKSGSISH